MLTRRTKSCFPPAPLRESAVRSLSWQVAGLAAARQSRDRSTGVCVGAVPAPVHNDPSRARSQRSCVVDADPEVASRADGGGVAVRLLPALLVRSEHRPPRRVLLGDGWHPRFRAGDSITNEPHQALTVVLGCGDTHPAAGLQRNRPGNRRERPLELGEHAFDVVLRHRVADQVRPAAGLEDLPPSGQYRRRGSARRTPGTSCSRADPSAPVTSNLVSATTRPVLRNIPAWCRHRARGARELGKLRR